MQSSGAYDELAPLFVAKGLHPVPIGPGTKKPCALHNGNFVDLPDWPTRPPITTPQPGAGIGLVMGRNGIIAMDLDNEDIAIALYDILPNTPVRKFGQRGETLFFNAPNLASRKFKIDGKTVCEILAVGTQTVLPPSVHPDTGQPYRWTGPKTLLDIDTADLPQLPDDIVTRIEEVLARFGYEPEPARDDTGDDSSDSPFRALNTLALKNLTAWIPALGIYNCKRRRGFHASYEAVATWRPSTKGRDPDKRDRNLKISPKGIQDFGDGRKYTPIDLVMAALACPFNEAVTFLDDKLGWSTGGPEINLDPPPSSEEQPEKEAQQSGADGAAQAKAKAGTKPPRFRLLRYCDLRPGIGDQDYVVEELLPAEGLVVVWGKFKCLKTFWVYDVMLHIAKGWEYRDRAVRQGLVIYCAFEGAHGFGKRTEAQRRHYNLADDDDVPLRVMPCQMNLVADRKKFVEDIKGQLNEGEKPAVVVLDTLNRSLVGSESKDSDMAAYVAAASVIREAFKCLVIIVHHCGWDESRPRGHSSLSAAIEGQLAVTRDGDRITVQIEFLRDGPEGAEIHSITKIIEVGEDANGKQLTSLVVMPSNRTKSYWSKALVDFRKAMQTALATHGENFCENVLDIHKPPVRAVAVEEVRKEFYAIYPADGETPEQRQDTKSKQFRRCLKRAQAEGLIQSREPEGKPPIVWFTDPDTTQTGTQE